MATASLPSVLRLLRQAWIATYRSANIVCTQFGNFNLQPAAGEPLIPRNFGQGPGFFSVNMRISKTWNFGTIHSAAASQTGSQARRVSAQGGQRGGGWTWSRRWSAAHSRSVVAVVQAAGGGGRGGGGGGWRRNCQYRPPGGGGAEAKRYSMQFSLNFQNLFNHVNLSPPVGNLSSPFFGQSLSLNGGFGGFGGGQAAAVAVESGGGSGAGNRKVTAQVRFNF